jgi:hypothetical protein
MLLLEFNKNAAMCWLIGFLVASSSNAISAKSASANELRCQSIEVSPGQLQVQDGTNELRLEFEQQAPLFAFMETTNEFVYFNQKRGIIRFKAPEKPFTREFKLLDELNRPLSAEDIDVQGSTLYLRSTFNGRVYEIDRSELTNGAEQFNARAVDDPFFAGRLIRGGLGALPENVQVPSLFRDIPLRIDGDTWSVGLRGSGGEGLHAQIERSGQVLKMKIKVEKDYQVANIFPLASKKVVDEKGRPQNDIFLQVDQYKIEKKRGFSIQTVVFRYRFADLLSEKRLVGPRFFYAVKVNEKNRDCLSLNSATPVVIGPNSSVIAVLRNETISAYKADAGGTMWGTPKNKLKILSVPWQLGSRYLGILPDHLASSTQISPKSEQTQTWANAMVYRSHKWTYPSEPAEYLASYEKPRHLQAANATVGLPYAWGCTDTPAQFDQNLAAVPKLMIGNINDGPCRTKEPDYQRKVAGIDCSGLVSNVFAIDRFITRGLYNDYSEGRKGVRLASVRSVDQITVGDIVNQPNSHVRLIKAAHSTPSGILLEVVEAASICGGVCHRLLPLAIHDRYVPWRFVKASSL